MHPKQLGTMDISGNRPQMLFRVDHSYAEITLEKAVQGALTTAQPLKRQTSKQIGNQINLIKNYWLTVKTQQTLDMQHTVTSLQTQCRGHLGRC